MAHVVIVTAFNTNWLQGSHIVNLSNTKITPLSLPIYLLPQPGWALASGGLCSHIDSLQYINWWWGSQHENLSKIIPLSFPIYLQPQPGWVLASDSLCPAPQCWHKEMTLRLASPWYLMIILTLACNIHREEEPSHSGFLTHSSNLTGLIICNDLISSLCDFNFLFILGCYYMYRKSNVTIVKLLLQKSNVSIW